MQGAFLPDQVKKPGILGSFGVQHITKFLAGKFLAGVVMKILAVVQQRDKIALVLKILAVAFQFGKGQLGGPGIVRRACPMAQHIRVGQLPGQRHFAQDGQQGATLVIEHLFFSITHGPLREDAVGHGAHGQP